APLIGRTPGLLLTRHALAPARGAPLPGLRRTRYDRTRLAFNLEADMRVPTKRVILSIYAIAVLTSGLLPDAARAADEKGPAAAWKAGAAAIKITPEKLMWMAGYASRTKPAE